MNNLNTIFIEGNLTKDPEAKQTAKGTSVTTLNVASNRYFKQGEEKTQEVSFFNVEFWSKQAEACSAHLSKGRGVRIRGRLKEDRWQDADGKWQSRVKIVGEDIEFKPQYKEGAPGESGKSAPVKKSGTAALPTF